MFKTVNACLVLLAMLPFSSLHTSAQVSFGEAARINQDWKFQKGDPEGAASPEFDDSDWRQLNLPHDWSVEGPYDSDLASGTGYTPRHQVFGILRV